MRTTAWILHLFMLPFLGACAGAPPPPPNTADRGSLPPGQQSQPETGPVDPSAQTSPPKQNPADGSLASPTIGPGPAPIAACKLPAPRVSEDACTTDADCGPSEPCHAKACVAKAKSKPRTPDIMCTMNIDCESADVNRCGCYEGRCALIPPNP